MGAESPNVILYDVNGEVMAVSDGVAIPSDTSALLIAGSDGTNAHYIALDSSGREIVVGAGTAGSPAGGVISIQGVSGGQAVPISGTIAVTQSGIWTIQPGNTANTTPWLATINQGGNSAIVTSSNALKIDGSAVTQPVSGTITSNQGAANSLSNSWPIKITDGTNTAAIKAASTAAVAADSSLVVAISPNNTANTKEVRSGTATVSSVTSAASSTTILAANSNRLGATIQNDANKTLYLRLGTPASTTNYTVLMVKSSYYEVPFNYTGIITGIWDSGVSGNARITELT